MRAFQAAGVSTACGVGLVGAKRAIASRGLTAALIEGSWCSTQLPRQTHCSPSHRHIAARGAGRAL